MKFFFPDSQDQVDPSFDFETETRSKTRIRQRDDLYAHEVFTESPYSGILVSMTMVDPQQTGRSRYTMAQRRRFQRLGVRRFFRLHKPEYEHVETMGDCGAFTYKDQDEPPYSPEQVADFYERCEFDFGVSVDHVVLQFQDQQEIPDISAVPEQWKERQELTLELADEFLSLYESRDYSFYPVGIAQGWSPQSYAEAVDSLQKMGYDFIALGGLVPAKTRQIVQALKAIDEIRTPSTRLHLFGISRFEHAREFSQYGVASIDSTAPLKKAFKSTRDNYYTPDGTYMAIRVPQVGANTKLRRRIKAGEVDQQRARKLQNKCLDLLRAYDRQEADVDHVLEAIDKYYSLIGRKRKRLEKYRETLVDAPWENCSCEICMNLGIDVVIFRGSERNKRRGFHNLNVFYNLLCDELAPLNKESELA